MIINNNREKGRASATNDCYYYNGSFSFTAKAAVFSYKKTKSRDAIEAMQHSYNASL